MERVKDFWEKFGESETFWGYRRCGERGQLWESIDVERQAGNGRE